MIYCGAHATFARFIYIFAKIQTTMKLQQLRYAVEVFRRNLNVSEAAEALFTSQPGVSKQIRLLEEELGTQIFIRSGKRIVSVTQPGQAILETAEQILREVQNIKNISGEFTGTRSGSLTLAASGTLARFRLPETVARFTADYPDVHLNIKCGSPQEVADMVYRGEADLALSGDLPDLPADVGSLPCGQWHYAVFVPPSHRLATLPEITLRDLADEPLLAYGFSFDAGTVLARAFGRGRVADYRVALAADDDDLLKTYVRFGLGVGLLNRDAHDDADAGIVMRDAGRLFEPVPVQILLRGDALIRNYVYDFIAMLDAGLTRDRVNQLLYTPAQEDFSI